MPRPAQKAPAQKTHSENPMNNIHFIGFDVHKKSISYCVKTAAGEIVEEGTIAGAAECAAGLGSGTEAALARSAGSDLVQRLDLRHAEGLQRRSGNGASGEDESHQLGEEEERHDRCADHRRPVALQPAAGLLRGHGAYSRTAAAVALSQPGGERSGAHEEQDGGAADGNGSGVCEGEAAWQEVLRHAAGGTQRGARIGDRSAALEPRRAGDVREHAAKVDPGVVGRCRAEGTRGTVEEHSGGGRNYGLDLGAGDRRSRALRFGWGGDELLRADGGAEVVGGQAAAGADLQAAQPLAADHA